jgi:hypothetical protein
MFLPICLCNEWPNGRGLVGAVDASGKPIFAGKAITALSNVEEGTAEVCSFLLGLSADMYNVKRVIQGLPFLLEDKIRELGGLYEKNPEPFGVSC